MALTLNATNRLTSSQASQVCTTSQCQVGSHQGYVVCTSTLSAQMHTAASLSRVGPRCSYAAAAPHLLSCSLHPSGLLPCRLQEAWLIPCVAYLTLGFDLHAQVQMRRGTADLLPRLLRSATRSNSAGRQLCAPPCRSSGANRQQCCPHVAFSLRGFAGSDLDDGKVCCAHGSAFVPRPCSAASLSLCRTPRVSWVPAHLLSCQRRGSRLLRCKLGLVEMNLRTMVAAPLMAPAHLTLMTSLID